MTTRLCDVCSVLSETEKTFCPECGTPYDRSLQQPNWGGAGRSQGLPLAVKLIAWLPVFALILFEAIYQSKWGPTGPWILGGRWSFWSELASEYDSLALAWYALGSIVATVAFTLVAIVISAGASNKAWCFVPLMVAVGRIAVGALSEAVGWTFAVGMDGNPAFEVRWLLYLLETVGVIVSTVALAVVGAVAQGGSR